jgi:predicted amidohydrolase
MSQLRSRAFENMTGIALANYAGVEQKGRSAAFDGMAFTPEGQSRDMVIAEADEGEQVLIAEFDLGALREYRTREVWGDEFRRPALYGVLVEREVKGPFVRSDVLKAEEDGR